MIGLSIIIPCYNSRQTILRCLKSIDTSLIDVEAIVVEDCSKDTSEDLIADYAKNTSISIKYIKNEVNLGAGETRNRGIREATKKYLTFLDSDDEFCFDYFEQIRQPLESNYDMVVYDATRIFNRNRTVFLNMFYSSKMLEGSIGLKETLVYIRGCTCGKIFKTSIIKNNNICFGSMPIAEDVVFTKIATSYMNNVYYIKKSLYLYYDNDSSLLHNNSLSTPQNSLKAYHSVYERLHGRSFDKELNSIYFIEVLFSATTRLFQTKSSKEKIYTDYRQYRKMYDGNDVYRTGYSLSFKIPYILFEYRLFGIYNILRKIYKKIF